MENFDFNNLPPQKKSGKGFLFQERYGKILLYLG